MPTFLEILWANLYSQDCARRFAAYSAAGLEVADLSAAQLQEVADAAGAFADAMVARAGGLATGEAALLAAIGALKGP